MESIHFGHEPSPEQQKFIERRLGGKAHLRYGPSPAAETTILVNGWPNADDLDSCPRLQTLVVPFTGVPPETFRRLESRPELRIYNMHFQSDMVAEGALALLLAVARRICRNDRQMREARWPARSEEHSPPFLRGKTALVFGMGAIGSEIARLCACLGMEVLGVSRSGRCSGEVARCQPFSALAEVLPQADALFIAAPLTEETRGAFGATELALMKPTALLVNVGRAEIVDEGALYEALLKGALGGAALDVWWSGWRGFEQEDLSFFRHPFYELDNVVLSPHVTWKTDATETARYTRLVELLESLLDGKAPKAVDRVLGY